MGRDGNFTCKDCKKTYYLGYGSYTTWLDLSDIKTVKEYDELDSPNKDRQKNMNYRKCLEEHEGHDWITWSGDWCYNRDNVDLMAEGGYSGDWLMCEGEKCFEHIDLENDS